MSKINLSRIDKIAFFIYNIIMVNEIRISDKIKRIELKRGDKRKVSGIAILYLPKEDIFSYITNTYQSKSIAIIYEFLNVKTNNYVNSEVVFAILRECEKRLSQNIDVKQVLLGVRDLIIGGEKQVNSLPIKEYIDSNFTSKIRLDDLADKFFLSKYYLIRLFKKENGMTPINYMIEKRIDLSQKLLITTNSTVKKISDECGFEDYVYFSKTFKERTGYSPSEYRLKFKLD